MSAILFRNNEQFDVFNLRGDPQVSHSGSGMSVNLAQGQMLQLNLLNERIVAFVSYVGDTPKAQPAPVFDFTSSEMVGVFMSLASIVILALYMLFYAPARLSDADKLLEDRLRRAVITFNPPPPVKKIERTPTPLPKPKNLRVRKLLKRRPNLKR